MEAEGTYWGKSRHLLILFLVSFCGTARAQPLPLIDPLPQIYMTIKEIQAIQTIPQARDLISQTDDILGQSPPPDVRSEFYGGNDIGSVVSKELDDYLSHIEKGFLQCDEWQFEGICYKCELFYCRFAIYKSYYYPVQTIEVTRHARSSEYVTDAVMDLFGEFPDYWYDEAKDGAPDELDRIASKIGAHHSNNGTATYDLSTIPTQFQHRNDWVGTNSVLEWRTVSTLAQTSRSYPVIGGACHNSKSMPIPYYSEAPLLIMLTRLNALPDLIFFIEKFLLQQKWGKDAPNYGVGTNMLLGHTPWDPFLQIFAPVPNTSITTPFLGPDYSSTRMESVEYSKGWLSSMLRATNFSRILPGLFKFYKYKEGDRKRSKYQWHYPDYMVDEDDSCDWNIDDYGNIFKPNYHPEISDKYDARAVLTQWNWFRCCPSGYDVLVGDEPQYKE